MKFKLHLLICTLLIIGVCCRNAKKGEGKKFAESRTSGSTTILVDESFAEILDAQIEVFKSEYPKTKFKIIRGNERQIIPQLIDGRVKMIVLSRMLKPSEENYYKKRQIGIYADRFAIDGIALITNSSSVDTALTVNQVFDILKGNSERKLVFDNANSSTVRYFMDSAKVSQLPSKGVYTLNNNIDVIKYISENNGFIGVVGLNWLLNNNVAVTSYLSKIKYVGIKNQTDKKKIGFIL